jgi:diguanylate cyclase (GGDEF)-like protein
VPLFADLGRHSRGWSAFALLLPLVVVADLFEVDFGGGFTMKMVATPLIAAALLLDPALVLVCGLAVAFGPPRHLRWQHRLFNGCNHALSACAAYGVGDSIAHGGTRGTRFLLAGVAATGVFVLLSNLVLALMVRAAAEERPLPLDEQFSQRILLPELALGGLGIVVAALWEADAPLVAFALLPLVLIWQGMHVPQLEREARLDTKTGLANARHLRESLASELERARRYGRPLSLMMADLDYLREVNNTYGHLAGDEVLAGIGEVLRTELRDSDFAGRFGGEEFCVILPETGLDRAESLAERVREAVAAREFGRARLHVTVSVGVAAFPRTERKDLQRNADAALYRAKARGKNLAAA